MELKWIAQATHLPDGNHFFEEFNTVQYAELFKQFSILSNGEKSKYKGAEDFIVKMGGPSLTPTQKNYKKFMDEIASNLEHDNFCNILPVNIYSEKETIMDLLASLENVNYIKSVYKSKKTQVSGELSTDTAEKLMDSIRQGRSLLQSAQVANMLSKPLIDFYAASAYAYATIVINSPLHKALNSLKGSHGHTYNHEDATIEFGGKTPSGTFTDLLASIYLPQIVTEDIQFKCKAISSLSFLQTHAIKISLIALLSTVPELRDQTLQLKAAKNSTYSLSVQAGVEKGKVIYIFEIGDGVHRPSLDSLKSIFNVEHITDANGKYTINVPADKITNIIPTIYQDINGKLWYIDPLINGFYLPEICLHFLIISALCNIMRYSPYEWNNILSNKISSDFSLLISKYLRLFELKYPMLLVQQLTNFLPIIRP